MPRTARVLVVAAIAAVSLNLHAQSPPQRPLFRGGTDLVQVDVSVLDGKRRPVRGLTAEDFSILEDGQPREIQAFTEVYLPDRIRAQDAAWMRVVPSDVATNQTAQEEGRVVIVLLDRTIPLGQPTITAKRIATTVINQLGPGDLGAVVSTSNGAVQNLTSDRSRLLRTLEESDLSTDISDEAKEIEAAIFALTGRNWSTLNDGRCLCGLCVLETIERVADAVQGTPGRRKMLFFIGSDLLLQAAGSAGGAKQDVGCESRLRDAREEMFRAVDRANLTIHSLDPSGLVNIGPVTRASSTLRAVDVADASRFGEAMHTRFGSLVFVLFLTLSGAGLTSQGSALPPVPTPADVKPGSITCDECPYPYPSKYLDIRVYSQDVRIAYMDVSPKAAANGHSVLLLHGNNFGGFYFKALIDGLTNAGFRVLVPDQIGYGRSSKPIAPYNFNSQARNTFLILQKEKIERVMVVGHSMGGMLAARMATQYPKTVERLVIYNPIGLTDGRFDRPMTPIDEAYEQTLKSDYQSIRASLGRYVAHNPKAWNAEFESYTRIRYSWTLSADWPRLAMVQALVGQMLYADPVVYDWAHIQVPTLAFGGAEDMLLGPAARFQERMQYLARTIPNGNGRLLLLPGLGHVPHLEAPDQVIPPLVEFLEQGLASK